MSGAQELATAACQHVRVCMRACVYIYTYVYIYICTNIHIYIYIHIYVQLNAYFGARQSYAVVYVFICLYVERDREKAYFASVREGLKACWGRKGAGRPKGSYPEESIPPPQKGCMYV